MNDDWLKWVAGVAVILFGWIGKRLHDRVDRCVTREELSDAIKEMRQERRDMHTENRDTLNRIHSRVDDLWGRTTQ